MSELAVIWWPVATLGCFAMLAKCAALWIQLRASAEQTKAERLELERGLTSIVEVIRKETHDARTEMRTFIANNRGRGG